MQLGLDQSQNNFSGTKYVRVGCAKKFSSMCTQRHAEISATKNFEVCAFWSYILKIVFETSWGHNKLFETFEMMCIHQAQKY